jgi:SAM-dependent methyltransferase
MYNTIKFDQVADIYDDYVNVDFDIPFFMHETENFKNEILELMCGTGRVSMPLLNAGRKLVCVDYSQRMLDAFIQKIEGKDLPVKLLNADVTELVLGMKFGIILLPFHSFSEIISEEKQRKALKKISNHLEDNGKFICTLQNPQVRLKTADGVLRILGEFQTKNEKRIRISIMNQIHSETGLVIGYQQYDLFDSADKLIEKRVLDICFRPVSYSGFLQLISGLQLSVENVYGDYSYSDFDPETSNVMIFILKKCKS